MQAGESGAGHNVENTCSDTHLIILPSLVQYSPGVLADDMGLGKTVQTVALVAALAQYKACDGPHLILAPKAVLPNWVRLPVAHSAHENCLLQFLTSQGRSPIHKLEYQIAASLGHHMCCISIIAV